MEAVSKENMESLELWNVDLELGADNIFKPEKYKTYKIVFIDDGEQVEGKFGKQVKFSIEGKDSEGQEVPKLWFVNMSVYINSLYGQLQRFRLKNGGSLVGKTITMFVNGKGDNKTYNIEGVEIVK